MGSVRGWRNYPIVVQKLLSSDSDTDQRQTVCANTCSSCKETEKIWQDGLFPLSVVQLTSLFSPREHCLWTSEYLIMRSVLVSLLQCLPHRLSCPWLCVGGQVLIVVYEPTAALPRSVPFRSSNRGNSAKAICPHRHFNWMSYGCSDHFRNSTNVTQRLKQTMGWRDEINQEKTRIQRQKERNEWRCKHRHTSDGNQHEMRSAEENRRRKRKIVYGLFNDDIRCLDYSLWWEEYWRIMN